MLPQFLKMMSRSSAKHAGLAAVLACALGAMEANAKLRGLDELSVELGQVQEPIIGRRSSDDIVVAQYVDDCGCDDLEDYGDDDAEDYDDDHAEDYGEDYDDEYHGDRGSVQSAHDPAGRILDRQAQIIEKTILWRNPMGPRMF